MKNLELTRMEEVSAGNCAIDSTIAVIGAAGFALALFSNPVGWIAMASVGTAIVGGGASIGSLVYNGNCF